MKRRVEYTVEVILDEDDVKELKVQENVIREMIEEAIPDATITITGRTNLEDDDEDESNRDLYDDPRGTD